MAIKALPSRALVRQLLHYDPETGVLTWLHRPREMFASKHNCGTWNTRYAGNRVGCVAPGGYHVVTFNSGHFYSHRLAWLYVYGEPVPKNLDHIDGDRANNRIANLRAATGSQNQANKGISSGNVLGIKGVRAYKGSFRAHIRLNGVGTHLGTFATAEEAAQAYRDAAARLHGEFARFD